MEERKLTVSQLNNYVKGVFDDELILKNITVFGEVFECNRASNNVTFLTLKDEGSILHCVSFRLIEQLEIGDTVAIRGSVEYYAKGNRVSFIIEELNVFGEGKFRRDFLALKDSLQKEGLFDNKLSLPTFIKSIAVVTSEAGAVIHDMLSVLKKEHSYIDVNVYSVKVQGDGAENDIVQAIEKVQSFSRDNVIILARGGGSETDLAAFNSEKVARAVATCNIPIISAVGHETDYSLCDYCATVRAGTPSIAAEIVCQNNARLIYHFYDLLSRLSSAISKCENRRRLRVCLLAKRLSDNASRIAYKSLHLISNITERVKASIDIKFLHTQKLVTAKYERLLYAANNFVAKKEDAIKERIAELNGANPLKIISGGYAKVYHEARPLLSVANSAIGDEISVVVKDGVLVATVNNIRKS